MTGFHLSLGLGREGKKKGFSVRRLGDSRAHPEDGSPRWPPHRALGCQPRASLLLMWLLIGDRKPQGLRPVVERFAPVRIFLPLYIVFSRSAAPCVQFADLQGKKSGLKTLGSLMASPPVSAHGKDVLDPGGTGAHQTRPHCQRPRRGEAEVCTR